MMHFGLNTSGNIRNKMCGLFIMFVYQFNEDDLYNWIEDILTDWTGEYSDWELFLKKRIKILPKIDVIEGQHCDCKDECTTSGHVKFVQ